MYELLAPVITMEANGNGKLAIADSKRLYKPGGTLQALERGVLAALAALDRLPRRWRDIWKALDDEALTQIDAQPWHDAFDESLPVDTLPDALLSATAAVADGCRKCGARLAELQTSVLFPAAFNMAVTNSDNKAEVLSLTTLKLARRVLERLPPGKAVVLCDKHGGRNHYAALLQHVFPDELVIVRCESAELSIYKVRHAGRLVEFRFQPKGERHLPTALASMTAKYLRELAMRPPNAYWQRHVLGLKATAGYYTDSHRFLNDIRAAKERLGIADAILWRQR
jgi:hypothetical protein